MSFTAWLFLVLVVLALAAASVLRRRQSATTRDRRTLPGAGGRPGALPGGRDGDGLSTLGLSPVRPATPRTDAVAVPRAVPRAPEAPAPGWADDDTAPSWTFDAEPDPASAARPAGRPADPPNPAAVLLDATDSQHDGAADGPDEALDAPSPSAPAPEMADANPATVRPEPAAPSGHAGPLTSVRPAPAAVRPDSPLWDPPGPAEHLLASLAACTGGTVAVLRHDGARYNVDALAGLNADVWPAPLDTGDGLHPLDRAPLDRLLSVLDDADLDALTYLVPGAARTALVRSLDESASPRVLVVATLAVEADHVDLATARLVGDYVDLLATLRADAPPDGPAPDVAQSEEMPDTPVDTPVLAELLGTAAPEAPSDVDDAAPNSGPDSDAGDADAPAPAERRAPDPLPRSVILTGEINAARDARRPLAFALVTLADAEALLDGVPDAADAAEADLATRLGAAPRVRRVEPFGPLLYGVFLDAAPDQVSPWARALSGNGPALHVGAVAPAGGTPDAVRHAATAALEDAYQQNVVCVVVD